MRSSTSPDLRPNARLWRLVTPLIAIILLQAGIASVSLNVLSAVRAYVSGESSWSKGQKNAENYLHAYVDHGLDWQYEQFLQAISIPLGDRMGRRALEQNPPDLALARQGLLQGNNHPDDIDGIIWLFLHFRNFPSLRDAIDIWIKTDSGLEELMQLAEEIRSVAQIQRLPEAQRYILHDRINDFDVRFAPQTAAFTRHIGEGSRLIKKVLIVANLAAAAFLVLLLFLLTRNFLAQRQGLLNEILIEKERAQITLASIGDAVISINADGDVDYMNPAAERMIGHHAASAKGKPLISLFEIFDDESGRKDENKIATVLAGNDLAAAAQPQLLRRHDGLSIAVSIIGAPLHKNGRVDGAVFVLRDMTDEKKYIANLSWQASHDALTNIANRREFERRLELSLQPNEADTANLRALMFIDLDQFKIINDTCGHEAGDKLLCEVSSALQVNLRDDDLLARLGGDEFAVLLENGDINHAAILAERLRHSVETLNFTWNGRPFTVTASIGLAQVAQGHVTRDEALRTADLACYEAKENGRNRVQIHSPGDSELLQRFSEMTWVQRIHDALDEERFCLFAQDIAPLCPVGAEGPHFELLLRLRDRDGKLLPPGEFLPAAERYGLMPLIDRWVVNHAFKLLARRKDTSVALCSINLSGATFRDDGFTDYVREQFNTYGIRPSTICFEITETSAIANIEDANRVIGDLQKLGCHFSLDDFGSGMSSFGYLKNLSVDYLKIDGSFVRNLLTDPIDRAMVEMICRIAQMMGKKTIAEFAENSDIINALRDIGVDYAQGYGVAMPAPFEADIPDDASRLRVVA